MQKQLLFAILCSFFCLNACYWQPLPKTSWHIQYEGDLDVNLPVDAYNIDLVETSAETISQLHNNGKKVICYFSAGSVEKWRPDSSSFPSSVIGKEMPDWPGEKWIDIRATSTIMPIMEARLDLAVSKGCDGVDPDNVNGFENDSGFPLTGEDQIVYNKLIAAAAHDRNMSCSLKNDLNQINDLVSYFDFQVNEQCNQYGECDKLVPFIQANKAVFVIEYEMKPKDFCPSSNENSFTAQLKHLNLDAYYHDCLSDVTGSSSSTQFQASVLFVGLIFLGVLIFS